GNTLSHGRDGAVQARAWATGRGNEHPDRALSSKRNICGFAGLESGATLEKNFGVCGKAIVICGDGECSGWLAINCSSDRKCGAKFGKWVARILRARPDILSGFSKNRPETYRYARKSAHHPKRLWRNYAANLTASLCPRIFTVC